MIRIRRHRTHPLAMHDAVACLWEHHTFTMIQTSSPDHGAEGLVPVVSLHHRLVGNVQRTNRQAIRHLIRGRLGSASACRQLADGHCSRLPVYLCQKIVREFPGPVEAKPARKSCDWPHYPDAAPLGPFPPLSPQSSLARLFLRRCLPPKKPPIALPAKAPANPIPQISPPTLNCTRCN